MKYFEIFYHKIKSDALCTINRNSKFSNHRFDRSNPQSIPIYIYGGVSPPPLIRRGAAARAQGPSAAAWAGTSFPTTMCERKRRARASAERRQQRHARAKRELRRRGKETSTGAEGRGRRGSGVWRPRERAAASAAPAGSRACRLAHVQGVERTDAGPGDLGAHQGLHPPPPDCDFLSDLRCLAQ